MDTFNSLGRLIHAIAGLIEELRPNFLIIVGVLAVITLEVVGWVDFGQPLLIKDPVSGAAYINATATLALATVALVVGLLGAVLKTLLEKDPPPTMTEQSAKDFAQMQRMAFAEQLKELAEILAKEYEKARASADRSQG